VNQPHGWLAAKWVRRHRRGVFVHRSHGFEPYVDEQLAAWQRRFNIDQRPLPRKLASAAMSKLLIERHGRLVARWAHGHIVSTSGDRNYLVGRMGVPRERVAVIAQAPPDEFMSTPAPPMTEARMRRVLYVGQFAFVKAPMIVAEAMKLLEDRDCTWVCSKKDHDAVRALAGPHVTLLDWMPVAQLRDIYDAHGVFLFPSFYEGFGKVFLEAMSRGLCVVATRTGGMQDVIEHGVDGMLVNAGDVGAIVDAVDRLTFDMSAAAAAKARQYSWDRVARECVAFYEELRR
jgi:glycosyltransferase involved in cell wall biosynthesis